MPSIVTIVKPNLIRDEEIKAFKRISHVLEKIVTKEYGIKAKFTLNRSR